MGKQVPLVYYQNGKRIQVGMASVEKDGTITASISKDAWIELKPTVLAGEFSIAPSGSGPALDTARVPYETRYVATHGETPIVKKITTTVTPIKE